MIGGMAAGVGKTLLYKNCIRNALKKTLLESTVSYMNSIASYKIFIFSLKHQKEIKIEQNIDIAAPF